MELPKSVVIENETYAYITEARYSELLNYMHLYNTETEKLIEQVRNQRDRLQDAEVTEQRLADASNVISNLEREILDLKEVVAKLCDKGQMP